MVKFKYKESVINISGRVGIQKIDLELIGNRKAGEVISIKNIRKMAKVALENTEQRDAIVEQLETIIKRARNTKEGLAAEKAVSTIIAVEMLEILKA
ncbi:MAG: hypothetical protein ACP5T4_00635 [Candidatus Micrarchaeia archaeon]